MLLLVTAFVIQRLFIEIQKQTLPNSREYKSIKFTFESNKVELVSNYKRLS